MVLDGVDPFQCDKITNEAPYDHTSTTSGSRSLEVNLIVRVCYMP